MVDQMCSSKNFCVSHIINISKLCHTGTKWGVETNQKSWILVNIGRGVFGWRIFCPGNMKFISDKEREDLSFKIKERKSCKVMAALQKNRQLAKQIYQIWKKNFHSRRIKSSGNWKRYSSWPLSSVIFQIIIATWT